MASFEIRTSKEVTAGNEDCAHITPASGKKVVVREFFGDAAYSKNSAVKLVWDYGGAGETVLWTIKGSSRAPEKFEINDADGVKKLGVCLDNGEIGNVFMSGFAEVWVED